MRKRPSLVPFWVLPILLAGCAGEDSPPLVVFAPTSITFADLAPRDIRFEAPIDRAVFVTVRGQGIDVRAGIVPGDGSAPAFADAPNRRMGVETLLVEAPHDPAIIVRIERNDNARARGQVRVEAVALPATGGGAAEGLAAARQEAAASLAYPDPARGMESARSFEAAARAREALGDRDAAGRDLLHAAGAHYVRLADWRAAADRAARAARLLEGEDSAGHAAFALRIEGAALDQYANAIDFAGKSRVDTLAQARERLTEAAERFRGIGNDYEAGYALNYRGVSFQVGGERQRAERDFRAALALFTAAGDAPAQALSLQSLGVLAYEEGRTRDALAELDRALALIPRATDPENYAHTLHNSAVMCRILGRFDEAIARYYDSGEILKRLGDRDGEARAWHGLGTVLIAAGEPERAAELLRSAINLRHATGARREQAVSLLSLGQIEREANRADAALALDRQALDLMTAPFDRAMVLLALARDELAAGRLAQAERRLGELLALALPETNRSLGLALAELAAIEVRRGRKADAEAHFARAIRIQEVSGSDIDRAATLKQRADAAFRAGNLAGALADSATAVALFDATGVQSLPAEHRSAFRARYRDAVELRIAALVRASESARQRGDDATAGLELRRALATSDRARAQLLADASAAAAANVPAGLLAERDRLYELLAGKRQQRERLFDSSDPDAAQVARSSREIELLRTRVLLVEDRIGKIAGSATGRGAAPDDIPLAAGPRDTVVAEYFIGRSRAWLFTLRDGAVTAHVLPPPAEIERLARSLHESWRHAARAPGDRWAGGRRLARMIYAPVVTGAPPESLWIVPDGSLHLVPMAVLARQAWPQLAPGGAMVVPSLAGAANRASSGPVPDRMLAVIADPVYTADDTRIRRPAAAPAAMTGRALTRRARDALSLRRLPATADEARELVELVNDPHATLALIGADASRERVLSTPLARYRIVHFATHALADSEDPALATLALSRWSPDGRPVEGALRYYDIARLRLNADLVVLSGCDTALGREIAGEGPAGLSQAFLRSGARSVVATLWQVPDTSTALLMRGFYRRMIVDGLDAAAALSLAQDELRATPRWSDPYFWAGFQLLSNARPAPGNNKVSKREES